VLEKSRAGIYSQSEVRCGLFGRAVCGIVAWWRGNAQDRGHQVLTNVPAMTSAS